MKCANLTINYFFRVLQLLDTYLSQVSVSDSSLNLTYSNLHVLAQTIPPEDARSNDIVYQSYFNQVRILFNFNIILQVIL